MAENADSFSSTYYQPESPKIHFTRPAGSGLTLVIPSLKSLKAQKASKDLTPRSASHLNSTSIYQDVEIQEKKIQRPIKLKPLKEVLSKLIAQLKKKDDYAFFLHPVDVANIPGYSDVVKHPMDLGTMGDKVKRGRYRSLEDFTSDFKLVTNNAKIFNPLGTIYHTEADRLETWGLDHISKAAATVIQYETDWNIEIEKDDESAQVDVVDDEDYPAGRGTPMDIDARERSVSVASLPQQPGPSMSRRGPRGPYKKQGQASGMSETLEPDGGLPGSKDGLGSFPAGSDWAKTMLALKRKGKRYKTKKERLRIERDGPPLLPDGSLDYSEMEDPFSVLSYFVPDPPSRPHLAPLFPSDPSSLSATTLPLDHATPALPFLGQKNDAGRQPRRRHWTIVRNAASRQKGKEREDEYDGKGTGAGDIPAWQMPRDAHATDFGSFAVLAGELAEEMRRRGTSTGMTPTTMAVTATSAPDTPAMGTPTIGTPTTTTAVMGVDPSARDSKTLDLIRNRLDCEAAAKKAEGSGLAKSQSINSADLLANGYWTLQRAAEAEEYVKDLVYGGVDGFAYVRSLAEFVDGDTYHKEEYYPDADDFPRYSGLGMPLARWVEVNIVDPLTEGRHSLLRQTAMELARQRQPSTQSLLTDPRQGTVASQVAASLHLYPSALIALSALLHIRLHKIDMGSLIKTPNELFLSEEEWVGKSLKEKRRNRMLAAKLEAKSATPIDAMEVEEPEQTWAGVDASLVKERVNGRLNLYDQEGPEELSEVLEHVASTLIELDRRNRDKARHNENGVPSILSSNGTPSDGAVPTESLVPTPVQGNQDIKSEDHPAPLISSAEGQQQQQQQQQQQTTHSTPSEDPAIRNLRLNLLALAKRAPLDTIARLPKDLVPEHIRHFVPTLGSA